MRFSVVVVSLIWAGFAAGELSTVCTPEQGAKETYRLSETFTPSNYKLDLVLEDDFATAKKFKGTVVISFTNNGDSTKTIRLHMDDAFEIDFAKIKLDGGTSVAVTCLKFDKTSSIVELELSVSITLGQHTLEIEYTGKLYEDMYGFYISTYGTDGVIATTQFESPYARRAFPCFDEPRFKATFDVSITAPAGFNAVLGNQKGTLVGRKTTFDQTEVMSTYLLAFIVSKFEKVDVTGYPEVAMAIYARPEAIRSGNAEHAKSETAKIIQELNKYTNYPYHTTKMKQLHQVAIPDFAAGAMENWGLVTYRETALLWDEKESSLKNKQRVSTVITHEFTHQWFGNLVTLNWWSNTWLNEGFATYFEMLITDKIQPDWQMQKQFVLDDLQYILQQDAVKSALPLFSEAYTPGEISAKFGSITYSKGGSIIRMMQHHLGESKFQTGLQKYLKDNEFKSTVPTDLFKALDSTGELEKTMKNWIEKSGHPIVQVAIKDKKVTVTQKRFLYAQESDNTKWNVPLTCTTKKEKAFTDTTTRVVLLETGSVELDNVEDWIVFNLQQVGYYRVKYDDELLKRIRKALDKSDFDGIDNVARSTLIDDVLNLARAGETTYPVALDFAKFLEDDVDYFPWSSAFTGFSFLRKRFSEGQILKDLDKYISKLMNKLYKSVSFDITTKEQIETFKIVLALQWGCQLGNSDCSKKAVELFQGYFKGTSVNPELRSIVYCNGLRYSGAISDDWTFLWNKFLNEQLATEQATMITALGCNKDETILNNYLKYSLDSTKIRKQDAQSAFNAVLTGTPEGVDICLDFLIANYASISTAYGSMNALSSVIKNVADRLTTQAQLTKFQEFVDKERANLKDAASEADAAIETAKANIAWADTYSATLSTYLNASFVFRPNFILTCVAIFVTLFFGANRS